MTDYSNGKDWVKYNLSRIRDQDEVNPLMCKYERRVVFKDHK